MPLTNEDFAQLDKARVALKRHATGKSNLQLAFEHIETMQPQLQRAVGVIELLVKKRNASWCFRVPRFFVVKWARFKIAVGKWQ